VAVTSGRRLQQFSNRAPVVSFASVRVSLTVMTKQPTVGGAWALCSRHSQAIMEGELELSRI
jgi:hypothetical protein